MSQHAEREAGSKAAGLDPAASDLAQSRLTGSKQSVTVDGHRLNLTNLDKVLYPATGTTKGDVLYYYAQIARHLIPHAANRPATRKRWVNGVGTADEPGEVFFQKNLDKSTPSWVQRGRMQHKGHSNDYPLVNDVVTLAWLGQIAALEIHVPQWQFGANGQPRNPDRMVLDLDPGEGTGLHECAEVARLAWSILTDMGLDPVPVTSGSKGIHLYAALDGSQNSESVTEVAHELARALEADHPDLVVSDMKKALRSGKVFVDWSQNSAAKTTVVPYSLRGRLHPTVACPRTWREVSSAKLEQLDYEQVLRRMTRRKDPMADLSAGAATVDDDAGDDEVAHEEAGDDDVGGAGGRGSPDRLSRYRSMRRASESPEPFGESGGPSPNGAVDGTAGQSFVIQEHHARNLHYDFRLEHDGVLVSWALPKGVPTNTGKNHLAVQTEDHPLDYGSFEGTIPKGQYGAGDVKIWDAGSYELEKWNDGKEIIATLHGSPDGGLDGLRRYALIHTGGGAGRKAEQNWLIHLMNGQPKGPPAASAQLTATGRSDPSARSGTGVATAHKVPDISPMLATLGSVKDLTDERDWAVEMKWDGIRALARVTGGTELHLISRNGNDMTASYPELTEVIERLQVGSAILDGEIVALNSQARPDFGLLQTRMKLTRKTDVEAARKKTPVHFMVFDLLYVDGESLLEQGFDERRRRLEEVLIPAGDGSIQLSPIFTGDMDEAVEHSRDLGLEGVMAKARDGDYASERRSRTWIKIKHELSQEVVIGGWRPGQGNRAGTLGSLLMGVHDDGGLRYVGRVGTGFSRGELVDLTEQLRKLERKTSPLSDVPRADASDAHWVTPRLVGEVNYAERTSAGKLRQPRWRGLRPDKDAAIVVPEG